MRQVIVRPGSTLHVPFSPRPQSTIFPTMRGEADVEAPGSLLGKSTSGKAVGTSEDTGLLLPPTVDMMGMGGSC